MEICVAVYPTKSGFHVQILRFREPIERILRVSPEKVKEVRSKIIEFRRFLETHREVCRSLECEFDRMRKTMMFLLAITSDLELIPTMESQTLEKLDDALLRLPSPYAMLDLIDHVLYRIE